MARISYLERWDFGKNSTPRTNEKNETKIPPNGEPAADNLWMKKGESTINIQYL